MGRASKTRATPFRPSVRQGLRWWQIETRYFVLGGLVLAALAWNVQLPDRQAQVQGRRS